MRIYYNKDKCYKKTGGRLPVVVAPGAACLRLTPVAQSTPHSTPPLHSRPPPQSHLHRAQPKGERGEGVWEEVITATHRMAG